MQNHYPTKDEILSEIQTNPPTENEVLTLKAWRKHYPKGHVTFEGLKDLIQRLLIVHRAEGIAQVEPGTAYCYVRDPSRILLDRDHPSIISTLHELGHALFGSSELWACAYSVGLFKAVYPKAYARLEWQGHMLRKPTNTTLRGTINQFLGHLPPIIQGYDCIYDHDHAAHPEDCIRHD